MTQNNNEIMPLLPYGMTKEDLDNVDVDKLKSAMIKGVYLVELLLFSQAQHEAARLGSTREVVDILFSSLYDTEKMANTAAEGGYTIDTKLELLKLANDMNKDRLKFLGDLHRNVASGIETVKSLERIKPDQGPADQGPSRKRSVREAKRAIEDQMAARVKELDKEVSSKSKS